MPTPYRIAYLTAADFERWDRFVDASPQGSIYSQSFYLQALCAAAGTDFRILAVLRGDEIMGGVALHFAKSRYGDLVRTRGLLYYNGLVLKDFETKHPSIATYRYLEILRTLLPELESGRYASVDLNNRHTLADVRAFLWNGWSVWPQYSYEVPISDLNRLWDAAEQNARRLITRCERAGMKLELTHDFSAFYALHKATYERKGVAPYLPSERFLALYEALRAHQCVQIFTALSPEGRPIAAQIVLFTGHPVTHTCAAGVDAAYLDTGVSAFLRWKVFEALHQQGFAYNDLTDAMNEPVAKFKSQFGGNLVTCFVMHRINSSALRLRYRVSGNLDRLSSFVRRRLSRSGPRPESGGRE